MGRMRFCSVLLLVAFISLYAIIYNQTTVIKKIPMGRASFPRHVYERTVIHKARPGMSLDHWQPVSATEEIFVYSAFSQRSHNGTQTTVRIIGAMPKNSTVTEDLYCLFQHADVTKPTESVKARVVYIPEGHNLRIYAAFFYCDLNKDIPPVDKTPATVSLVVGPQMDNALNFLQLHNNSMLKPRFNLTACVCPIFRPERSKAIVEWVETNKILGVEFFTVYANNVSDSELKILKHYESMGILEILNWNLSNKNSEEPGCSAILGNIHYLAQLAALNDCAYRNKGRSVYTMTTDLDELILPQKEQDWTLLDMIIRLSTSRIGCFYFRHAHHRTVNKSFNLVYDAAREYEVDVKMINNFQRSDFILPVKVRSKMIFQPKAVVTLGIHYVRKFWKPYTGHTVDTNIALLHHYRNYIYVTKYLKGVKANRTEDRTSERYLEMVLTKMNQTLNAIRG